MQDIFNKILDLEVANDLKQGDVTTNACIKIDAQATGLFNAREDMVLAGIDFAIEYLNAKNLTTKQHFNDGDRVKKGDCIFELSGNARYILVYERSILNMVQHLSGIASKTAKFVAAVKHTNAKILDTRKTLAGLRELQKYAVKCGGGENHRMGLYDVILLKDNHIVASGGIENAIKNIAASDLPKIVECDTLEQIQKALDLGIKRILADNMCNGQDCATLKQAVEICNNKAKVEASGGITLDNVKAAAETGVDFISVGALTHTVRAVDIGLDFIQK